MSDKTDFYRRLNIGTSASEEAIKKAYRLAVKKTHPDVNKHTGATQHFLDIQEAYQVLSNPDKKGAYDMGREPDSIATSVYTAQEYSQSALLRQEEPQIVYSLLDIVSSEDDARDVSDLPLNISLVLDTSTSMAGARLDILKAATKEIIQDLDKEDIVSVVSFNDRAKVLMPSQADPTPTKIETSLNSLIAEGGTEIFQGLEAGYEEIKQQTTYDYVNHIILITDGHTYGDEDNCIMLAKRAATQDIGISGFGIGIEWNDEFIDQLCALTGGHCSFIQEQRNLKDFLKATIESLKKASSRRVSLEVTTAPGVKMLSAFRIQPESLPLPVTEEYSLGTLRKHEPHRVLFEFLIEPIPADIDLAIIASGEFTLKRRMRDQAFPFTLDRPLVENEDDLEPPIQEMFTAISHLTFFRLQEKAQRDVTSGNPGTAYQRLINLSSHLMAKGEDSLARIAMNEAEHIKSHSNFSPDGKKQLKYGTIRLMLPDKT